MALAGVPPWLDITPETFTGQMRAGAGLGAQLRGQDIQAQEAGDRLSLAYAQLASQEERAHEAAQARMQLAGAQLTARQQQADLMAQFRQQSLQQGAERAAELSRYREETLAQREKSGTELQALREARLKDLDQFRAAREKQWDASHALAEKNLALREATAKAPRLTESDKALMAADVSDLKGIEKKLSTIEPVGFGLLHPLGGNKKEIEDLKGQALQLRARIAGYEPKSRELGGATPTGEAAPTSKKRVRVVGPGGKKGTIEEGDTLPEGWTLEGQ